MSEPLPDAQPRLPRSDGTFILPQINEEESSSETYSEYAEPVTQTDPTEPSIHLTDIANCREALATLSSYHSGQIGQYLKNFRGLLILPLHSVSIFRMPHGRHTANYPILIYFPTNDLKQYPHLQNFNDAIGALYPQNDENK